MTLFLKDEVADKNIKSLKESIKKKNLLIRWFIFLKKMPPKSIKRFR